MVCRLLNCRDPCLERQLCQTKGIEQRDRRKVGLVREMEKERLPGVQEVHNGVPHFPCA